MRSKVKVTQRWPSKSSALHKDGEPLKAFGRKLPQILTTFVERRDYVFKVMGSKDQGHVVKFRLALYLCTFLSAMFLGESRAKTASSSISSDFYSLRCVEAKYSSQVTTQIQRNALGFLKVHKFRTVKKHGSVWKPVLLRVNDLNGRCIPVQEYSDYTDFCPCLHVRSRPFSEQNSQASCPKKTTATSVVEQISSPPLTTGIQR